MSKESTVRKKQAASTRAALIRAAADRFGAEGYHRTTLDAVAGDVGVTKGAAYHHFADKQALFAAVFVTVQRRLVLAVARESSSGPPLERLRQACAAYLDKCNPGVARIVLIDGPALLGEVDWHETEDRLWLRALRDLIVSAQRDGQFALVDIGLAARVISASLTELATAAIDGEASSPPADAVQLVLATLLRGFEPPGVTQPDEASR